MYINEQQTTNRFGSMKTVLSFKERDRLKVIKYAVVSEFFFPPCDVKNELALLDIS